MTSQTRWMAAFALSMTVLFVSSGPGVLASNSDRADLEITLEKSLDSMTCNESKNFVQDHITPEALATIPANVSSDLGHDKDKCSKLRHIIHDVVSQSFQTSDSESGDVHVTFLPPISCLECAASLCSNVGFCLHCCFSGFQPICFVCP